MMQRRHSDGRFGDGALRRGLHRAATLLLRTEGAALIETAMVFTFIGVPLMIGTAEIGQVTFDSIAIANAAVAGAIYGSQGTTNAADSSGITSAAQAEGVDAGVTITVTPTVFYVCSNAITGTKYTGANAESNAASACTGTGVRPLEFIGVATSGSVAPAVKLAGLATSFSLHGYSAMEVAQ
jgi:hypothetical protein